MVCRDLLYGVVYSESDDNENEREKALENYLTT